MSRHRGEPRKRPREAVTVLLIEAVAVPWLYAVLVDPSRGLLLILGIVWSCILGVIVWRDIRHDDERARL
jgi:hypothetical protein